MQNENKETEPNLLTEKDNQYAADVEDCELKINKKERKRS